MKERIKNVHSFCIILLSWKVHFGNLKTFLMKQTSSSLHFTIILNCFCIFKPSYIWGDIKYKFNFKCLKNIYPKKVQFFSKVLIKSVNSKVFWWDWSKQAISSRQNLFKKSYLIFFLASQKLQVRLPFLFGQLVKSSSNFFRKLKVSLLLSLKSLVNLFLQLNKHHINYLYIRSCYKICLVKSFIWQSFFS